MQPEKPVHPDWLPLQFSGNHARVMIMSDMFPSAYKGCNISYSESAKLVFEDGTDTPEDLKEGLNWEFLEKVFGATIDESGDVILRNSGALKMTSPEHPFKEVCTSYDIKLWESCEGYRDIVLSKAYDELIND